MKMRISFYFISFYFQFIVIFFTDIPHAIDKHCHNGTGRCYWAGKETKSWGDARTACQSDGGDLAVMETEELYNFLNDSFSFR